MPDDIIDVIATEVPDPDRLTTGQQKISGYRDLTPDEIATINKIKTTGLLLGELIDSIAQLESAKCTTQSSETELTAAVEAMRWASTAKTHLQLGMMCLTRAVAKPQGF